jgi:hypothetical protein
MRLMSIAIKNLLYQMPPAFREAFSCPRFHDLALHCLPFIAAYVSKPLLRL